MLCKPCPFCGSKAELRYSDMYYWVECTGCHAKSEEEGVEWFEQGSQTALEKSYKKWNRRLNPMLDCCCFGGE